MKVAINGTGVAGPTLAWWLKQYGHEPVLFERAPKLRTGGYLIDFWGVGYDVAEAMGILPALHEKGYIMRLVRNVDRRGRTVASLDVNAFRRWIGDRFMSIPRGDLAATVFHACNDIETRFGREIAAIDREADGVRVRDSAGAEERFDLVVGADGLHSRIRSLAFGRESQFERHAGCHVAAFALDGYEPRDESVYVSHAVPKRQVARAALRDDRTMFLFVFRSELLGDDPIEPSSVRSTLRRVFGDMEWEVPRILARIDEAEEVYFDRVSQIRMDRWTQDRVALVGDAAACASLLAGEGTGLGMTEAYVLAGELHRSHGSLDTALAQYEKVLKPFITQKQDAALGFVGYFAPKTSFGLFLRNLATNASALPLLGSWLIGRSLRDDFRLPDYQNS